jgi:hypothetical protein
LEVAEDYAVIARAATPGRLDRVGHRHRVGDGVNRALARTAEITATVPNRLKLRRTTLMAGRGTATVYTRDRPPGY